MVHTRMSALGWVVGGTETIVRALLEVLGPDGTLVAYASWQEHVYRAEDRPAEHREAYAAAPPAFDPATGEVDRDYGRLPERVRTWPGALRRAHPEASVAAIGARAAWITGEHPDDDGNRTVTYRVTLAGDGGLRERTYTDIDTSLGAFPYDTLGLEEDEFAVIARAALDAGIGVRGKVGDGESHLFPAPALTAFAVAWMEERFA